MHCCKGSAQVLCIHIWWTHSAFTHTGLHSECSMWGWPWTQRGKNSTCLHGLRLCKYKTICTMSHSQMSSPRICRAAAILHNAVTSGVSTRTILLRGLQLLVLSGQTPQEKVSHLLTLRTTMQLCYSPPHLGWMALLISLTKHKHKRSNGSTCMMTTLPWTWGAKRSKINVACCPYIVL